MNGGTGLWFARFDDEDLTTRRSDIHPSTQTPPSGAPKRHIMFSANRCVRFVAMAAFLLAPANRQVLAADVLGAAGSDGAGHNGTVGDTGGDGGAARTVSGADGDVTNPVGDTFTGGAGGDGRALVAGDAQSVTSTTLGLDGTAALPGQAGIAAGDSLDVTVDGVTQSITINAADTLSDIAAKIEAAFPTLEVSATATGTNDTLTIGQGGTVIDDFVITNNNNTPLTAMGFAGPFPRTVNSLFDDGGSGGTGGVAVVLDATSDDTFENLATIIGGAGGAGGGTLYRTGDGGNGGDGGAGVRKDAGTAAAIVNRGSIEGGAGGVGGAGGDDGADGADGAGGIGIVGSDVTVTNSGTIAGGLGGDGATRADAIRFTGGANTLVLEAGSTITGDVVAFSAADTLSFGGTSDSTFDASAIGPGGQYQGFGAIGKTGSGTWIFTGAGTYTADTTVDDGTLLVNGSLASEVTVGPGGVLGGNGTLGGGVVNNGTLAPGNSIGTLAVTGPLTFGAGSIYEVEVNAAGQSDRTDVTGTATLAGTMRAVPLAGSYAYQTDYTILTATNPLVGTFDSVTSASAFFVASLIYGTNDITLRLTRNNTDFTNVAVTWNQIAVAGALDAGAIGASGDMSALLGTVSALSADDARAAFDQLSGEIHASAKTALIEDSRFVRRVAMDRVRNSYDGVMSTSVRAYGAGLTGWGHVFGSWGGTDSDGNAAELRRETGGLLVGVDGIVSDAWRLGVLAGYSRSNFDSSARASSGESNNMHLGLYGGTQWGAVGFRAGAAHSWHDLETTRFARVVSDTLEADYGSGTAQAFGELGYRLDGPVALEPFAGLAFVNLHTDGYREAGGVAPLSGRSSDTGVFFSTVGLRVSTKLKLGKITAAARGLLGWRHAFGDTVPLAAHSVAGSNQFFVAGVPIADDMALIEAGVEFSLTRDSSLNFSYSGQLASDAHDHGVNAVLSVQF